ncbi:hypothetical protein RND81_12G071800 [Saponaria officinalis]|uniref:Replication protein A 70 kDa DNA-binding subunit B/D first OB fold domain-containing protein n=1 Tax=Saponaria officinalis TaxID=3572 RepID=A0AAW1H7L1_SAPOF
MALFKSTPISEITPQTTRDVQITTRVMRMWVRKSDTEPKDLYGVELILVDEQGNNIQASVGQRLTKWFLPKLNEGDVYKIRKFSISPNSWNEMATYHPCRIWFEYSTKIVPIPNANIPLYVYNFVTFDEIFQGSMPNGLYIDVVAKLEHVYPTRVSSKNVKWRQIIIENARQQQICCSIFGEHLDTISEIEAQYKDLKKPTMVLLHVKRSEWEGEVTLTTIRGATKFLVNPDMEEVRVFNHK